MNDPLSNFVIFCYGRFHTKNWELSLDFACWEWKYFFVRHKFPVLTITLLRRHQKTALSSIIKIASNLKQWSEFIINLCWTSMLIQNSFHNKCPLTAGSCTLRAAGCCTVVYIMFIAILLCSLGLWRQGKAVQYATAVGGNATHKRWQSDDIHFMASLRSCAVLHIVIKTANMFKKPFFLTL